MRITSEPVLQEGLDRSATAAVKSARAIADGEGRNLRLVADRAVLGRREYALADEDGGRAGRHPAPEHLELALFSRSSHRAGRKGGAGRPSDG